MDIVTIWAGAATLGCAALTYLWLSTRIDRDEARSEAAFEQQVADALRNRVETLRTDNVALEREAGRIKAEKVAMRPKRDARGRFIPKAKA